ALRILEPESLRELGRERLDRHAEPAARHLALGGELGVDALGHVHGNREADTDIAPRAGEDRAVDADDLAAHVHGGATAVPRIDRGVGLEESVERALSDGAALRTDDARRHGLLEPERRSDREHPVADLDLVGVTQVRRREWPGALKAEHREVRPPIDA